MAGYVERMCDMNSSTDAVMLGVRFFLVMRMLRGGEGHWRFRSVLFGLGTYEGRRRGGRSWTGLISRCDGVLEKARTRTWGGSARSRHGRTRWGTSFIVG